MNALENREAEISLSGRRELSSKDIYVLQLAACGHTLLSIARLVNNQKQTIKNRFFDCSTQVHHRLGICEKLGVDTEVEAVVTAIKKGMIDYRTLQVMTGDSGAPEEKQADRGPVLTKRQKRILILKARGFSRHEIGHKLNISAETVDNHLCSRIDLGNGSDGIYARLEVVSSPCAAVVRALQLGIVKLEEI